MKRSPTAVFLSMAIAAALGQGLAGCSQKEPETAPATEQAQEADGQEAATQEADETDEEASVPEEPTLDVIGNSTSDAKSVTIRNRTGSPVVSVSIRKSGKKKFKPLEMAEGDVLSDGEKALLCFTPQTDDETTQYDIRFVTENGRKRVYLGVPLQDVERVVFKRGDRVNFVN